MYTINLEDLAVGGSVTLLGAFGTRAILSQPGPGLFCIEHTGCVRESEQIRWGDAAQIREAVSFFVHTGCLPPSTPVVVVIGRV